MILGSPVSTSFGGIQPPMILSRDKNIWLADLNRNYD